MCVRVCMCERERERERWRGRVGLEARRDGERVRLEETQTVLSKMVMCQALLVFQT